MSIHASFERRVVLTAALFLGDQVPAYIYSDYVRELPDEARADIKAYMAEMHRQFAMLEPVLTTADFSQQRGGVIDAMELANQLNEKYADKGILISVENIADRDETPVSALLAGYAEAIALL